MSRRLQTCRTCKPGDEGTGRFSLKRGKTRHDDGVCSRCRRGVPTASQQAADLAMYRTRGA
jgi:hypothetical protein